VKEFDLTPDPRVLIALTHTPLQPLDALCELIDNAIDSFHAAELEGAKVEFPLVVVELPSRAEVDRGEGMIRVRDNGAGMTADQAEKALRAGFSGNKSFDTLGLFGMGFNVSTGKLGRVTRFHTARADADHAIEVVIDLVRMQESGSYRVPVAIVPKLAEVKSGTIVEITGWWPEGNPNSGFIKNLAGYSKPKVREQVGSRYSAILRQSRARIVINQEACRAFEHCVWDASRYVERRERGRIAARFDFDTVLGHQTRCSQCNAKIVAGETECPACKATNFRTMEERLTGWLGIQRFDDKSLFGVDLIRNGRAIRLAEKAAFFEFTDEFKRTITDYPIDNPYGRIVGEVHMDHVPVDFLKQDFQRSSEEWQRAISFLRGDSSLQPGQPNADKNKSPMFNLYQGYRRVRTAGTADMYMGYWDRVTNKPKRISREVELDYYQRFLDKVPGFYEDTEWWKEVEKADHPPVEELSKCPACGAENLNSAEECLVCGNVLIGQICINEQCARLIPQSAVTCPHCGVSQVPEIKDPWSCQVCGLTNTADAEACVRCSKSRGTLSPSSRESLSASSDKDDDLSFGGCSVVLSNGSHSQPIDVNVYATRQPIVPRWGSPGVPLIGFKGESIDVYIDLGHPMFKAYQTRPELLVAEEIAQYLYTMNGALIEKYQGEHTIGNLTWRVLEKGWGDELEDTPDRVKEDSRRLFDAIRSTLVEGSGATLADFFAEMTEQQMSVLVANVLGRGLDVGKIDELRATGRYVVFINEESVVDLFRKAPQLFLDDRVWRDRYTTVEGLPESVTRDYRSRIRATYLNCLEDAAAYLRYETPEPVITQRARGSIDYLQSRLLP
jgi:hypothetical protein